MERPVFKPVGTPVEEMDASAGRHGTLEAVRNVSARGRYS